MSEKKYKVSVSGVAIARGMDMPSALLFVEAFFKKYNAEDEVVIARDDEEEKEV